MKAIIDINIKDAWIACGSLTVDDSEVALGYVGRSLFYYLPEYVAEYSGEVSAAVSCGYPVNFERHHCDTWPAFILDILPSGAARREMLVELGLKNNANADWELLIHGGGNPIGNIRIREAVKPIVDVQHSGFDRTDVLERQEDFIRYAKDHGAPVSGSSGAQGDAPKFLLTQDKEKRWHADGALFDGRAEKHWIVKFPRGKQQSDRQILKNEAAYYGVAKDMGLYVGEPLTYENNTLFIPRFDREIKEGKVIRYHVESVASIAGIAEYGARPKHDFLVEAIAKCSTDVQADIEEYVARDILNLALGNTDNHARNTAMMVKGEDRRLTPLFDFAPMYLDDQGIARVCRWETEFDEVNKPDWYSIFKVLVSNKKLNLDVEQLKNRLAVMHEKLKHLVEVMSENAVDDDIIEHAKPKIKAINENLSETLSKI